MTDRTHPDSGRIITSSDILLHDAKTALMYEELRAAIDDGHESMTHADALAEIAAIRAENTMLRQHAAKQITDATLLTGISPRNGGMDIGLEGGACQLLAEAFFDQFVEAGAVNFLEIRLESSTRMPGKAMTVTMQLADGATPGQKIAEANARIAELEAQLESIGAGGVSGPLMGKPQAMPDLSALTERGAKAWAGVDAQGLREGAASAGSEPMFWVRLCGEGLYEGPIHNARIEEVRKQSGAWSPLYLHPSPPEGMVGGWIALPGTLPDPGTPVLLDIGKKYPIRAMWAAKHTVQAADDDTDWGEYDEATDTYYCPEGWYEWNEHEDTNWAVSATPRAWATLPPTTSADSGKGD